MGWTGEDEKTPKIPISTMREHLYAHLCRRPALNDEPIIRTRKTELAISPPARVVCFL